MVRSNIILEFPNTLPTNSLPLYCCQPLLRLEPFLNYSGDWRMHLGNCHSPGGSSNGVQNYVLHFAQGYNGKKLDCNYFIIEKFHDVQSAILFPYCPSVFREQFTIREWFANRYVTNIFADIQVTNRFLFLFATILFH